MSPFSSHLARRAVCLTFAGVIAVLASAAAANDPLPKAPKLPPALEALRMGTHPSPDAFVAEHLSNYRQDMELMEELLKSRGEDAVPEPAGFDALLSAAEKNRPTSETVSVVLSSDSHIGTPPELPLPDSHVFIRSVRIQQTPGLLHRSGVYAADAKTAAALGIPDVAGLEVSGRVQLIFSNEKVNGCCMAEREQANGQVVCTRYAQVPTVRSEFISDLRALLGKKIIAKGEGMTVRDSGVRGITFSRAGVFTLNLDVQQGAVGKSFATCVRGGRQATSYQVDRVEKRQVSFSVVQMKDFGVPGLDQNVPTPRFGRVTSQKDYFRLAKGASTRSGFQRFGRFKPGEGEGNPGSIARPVVVVEDSQGNVGPRSDISHTVKELNVGPFDVSRSGVVLPRNFRPGASRVVWRLGGNVEEREHVLTANRYNVEIDERALESRMIDGEAYEVRVVVEGPADLSGYTIDWGGNVNWAGAPAFEKDGGRQVAKNTFQSPLGNQFPEIQIKFTGPFGEIFEFNRSLNATVDKVAGIQFFSGKGSFGAPEQTNNALDFFFPTADDQSAMTALFRPVVESGRGPLELLDPNSDSEIVRNHLARSEQIVVFENPNVIDRGGLTVRPGFVEAVLKPAIGATRVVGHIGGPTLDPRNDMGTEGGRAFVSAPVDITVNSVRLIRRSGGFDLLVRGPGDLTSYEAIWTRRKFSGASARFEKTDDGWKSSFDTKEKLSKVEIVKDGQTHAMLPAVMAVIPADIRLLPLKAPINQVEKARLRDFSDVEARGECIEDAVIAVNFLGGDLGGQTPSQFCKGERDFEKTQIREQRDAGKRQNRLIRDLQRQGKELISFSDSMDVAAVIKGMPAPDIGRLVCLWTIQRGGPGLRTASRTTSIQRSNGDATEGACMNKVVGIREGFAPDAKLRVSLILDDTPALSTTAVNNRNPIFNQGQFGANGQ